MLNILIAAVVAYLLGSIPFGYILMRIFRDTDVRLTGSGNIGATNVARSAPVLGVVTLFFDGGKAFVAVMLAHLIALSNLGSSPPDSLGTNVPFMTGLAAFCAIAGHIFPVWLKFRGGKGVASGVGGFLAIIPKIVLVALVIFAVVLLAFRYVSLGSIIGVASMPILAYATQSYHDSPPLLAFITASSVLIIARHHQNIGRLLAGSEPRLGRKPASGDAA
jgi:acyl phosphate:glycerol-3-phosphate acyltransferase